MIKKIINSILMSVVLMPLTCFALILQEAKDKGLVGEKPDGYIGAVSPSSEIDSLVKDINEKREREYKRIANENHKDFHLIEEMAGAKLIKDLSSGEYFMSGGKWIKK